MVKHKKSGKDHDKNKEKESKPAKAEEAVLSETDLNEETVEESLRTIYEAEEGKMPDMTKLEKIKSKRWIWITGGISAAILLLILVAWAGFAFFKTFQGFSGKALDMEVEGPEKIALGQEITYFVNYKNSADQPLASVDVRVNFPSDFVITEMKPKPTSEGNVWRVGALAAQERGTIKIRGRFTGALGTISAVQAIATYRPANYSSDFEAMATKQIEYAETVIEGFIQVPEKAVPGDSVALIYHYKNSGAEELENLVLQFTVPEGFAPDMDAMGTSTLQGRVFEKKLGDLKPGEQSELSMVGTFASGFGGDAEILAKIGTVGPDGRFLPMHVAEKSVPVLAGDLSLNFIVNGSEQKERTASYGEELRGIIGYENMADESLSDIVIRMKLETIDLSSGEVLASKKLVDMGRLSSSATTSVSGAEVVWDKTVISNLESLPPRGSGSIDVNLPIVYAAPDKGAVALRVNVSADVRAVGDTELNRTITMAPMTFVMLSDASLSAEARYFTEEGAPIGTGPLPPKVGEATTYRIIWKLNKTVHALKDVQVEAKLPRSVSFNQVATSTAGEMQYIEAERKLVWSLNRMPAGVGQAEVLFNVSITPVAADDGRFAILMDDITFQATDEDIDEPILLVIKELNTDLQNDENAAGKGVVVK
ncbi:hypothetical protein GF391_03620 [Candidatus Uhrbacteria bacterium]|nr:hypothetical protein [Candidatus Uhrbacteria bacterium]